MQSASSQSHSPLGKSVPQSADWLLLALPGLIWGASFLFIAEGLTITGASGVAFFRILAGFATLSLFPSARRPVARSEWLGITGLGFLWLALPLTLFPLAERHVSSALTGMLNGANSLFTAVVAAVIARCLPSRRVMTGLGVGLTGAMLMAIPAIGEGHSSKAGVGMILGALISYAFALNLARPLQQRNGALPVIWRALIVALALTAPLGVPDLLHARWKLGPLCALLALGALGTGAAHALMAAAAGRFGATRASGTTFLIPPVALVLGVLVRHEKVALLPVLGSVACVGGAWLMRHARSSEEESSTAKSPGIRRRASLALRPRALYLAAGLFAGFAVAPVHGQATAPKERARVVQSHDLPMLDGTHLKATLVEVNYGPGEASTAHSHPCAVLGYVVAGSVRFQVMGEPEKLLSAGESFYEGPNRIHLVSANASATEPAKLIAYLICDHETPLSVNVDQKSDPKGSSR
jgi:drug/metabolite transporter (DMT)-like permease/quercetin dioxygenase-like cupin family protein